MPNGSASILLASASTITRLAAEAGLRGSFFGIFPSTSVLDTVGGGDSGGLDGLLDSRVLVGCDRRLFDSVDPRTPDAERVSRYRANFVAKLARRRVLMVVVLDEGEVGETTTLESCHGDVTLLSNAGALCQCEIIIVATSELRVSQLAIIQQLQANSNVRRVYVMTKWLQPGNDNRHVALADHVWPMCVGRLLAVRALADEARSSGANSPIVAWRTFAWGTLANDAELPAWESEYLHSLRDCLLPPLAEAPERPEGKSSPANADGVEPVDLPPMQWSQTAAELSAAGNVATQPQQIHELTNETCRNAAVAAAVERLGPDPIGRRIQLAWAGVAVKDGLTRLRQLCESHIWRSAPLKDLTRTQESRWRGWNQEWRTLEQCRMQHGKALDVLTLARSRHLSLAWQFIIGAMILPFVFQFIAGILFPLRPEAGDVSPLFAAPKKGENSIAYLVDRSSSMDGIRLERMKEDLRTAISALPDGIRFTAIAFNEGLEEIPLGAGELVEASAASRAAAMDWVDGLTASGTTLAVPGLQKLAALKPDVLVFLTDGLFAVAERDEIEKMASDKSTLGDIRFETIMLYPVGDEPAMKTLARVTGGQFHRVTFDPFAPLGFNRVLAIAFGATVAGVALGALLPWLLERRAGIAGTSLLEARLQQLLKNYGQYSKSTAVMLEQADRLAGARREASAWRYQSALASRAVTQLEASLKQSVPLPPTLRAGHGVVTDQDPLHAEDVRDFHDALDEPLPRFRPGDYQRSFFRSIAANNAREIGDLWSRVAAENDLYSTGHIPIRAIAERFGDLVGRFLMEASRRLLLPRGRVADAAGPEREPYYELFANLARRLVDEPHRPFLSARVTAGGGAMPRRELVWIGTEWADTAWHLDGVAREFFRKHTPVRFVSEYAVNDIGLLALGLVHDEFEVIPHVKTDGIVEFTVGNVA